MKDVCTIYVCTYVAALYPPVILYVHTYFTYVFGWGQFFLAGEWSGIFGLIEGVSEGGYFLLPRMQGCPPRGGGAKGGTAFSTSFPRFIVALLHQVHTTIYHLSCVWPYFLLTPSLTFLTPWDKSGVHLCIVQQAETAEHGGLPGMIVCSFLFLWLPSFPQCSALQVVLVVLGGVGFKAA